MKHINFNNQFNFGQDLPFVLIAGPCQMESKEHAIDMAGSILEICKDLNIPLIYKTSFDKANRTSLDGKRGLGLEKALPVFADLRKIYNISLLTDIHDAYQCAPVSEYVDVLQIPAFLCRQTDLLIAAAKTNKIINIKKGQFLSPYDMKHVINKIININDKIILTDRGVSFGYNNLISDMRSLVIMHEQTDLPVVIDVTHSLQQPGGLGGKSGGQREFIPALARASVGVGVAGVFMEVHQDPDNAPSDGPNMLKLANLKSVLEQLVAIDKLVKDFNYSYV